MQGIKSVFVMIVVQGIFSAASAKPADVHSAATVDSAFFDGNRILSYMQADGLVISHNVTGSCGLLWPKDKKSNIGFASSLSMIGRVEDEIRTAWSEYAGEFVPGPAPAASGIMDSSAARIYKISRHGRGDWDEWPWQYGAPVLKTASGADSLNEKNDRIPRLIGDQTLWMVINDADRQRHWFSEPLGIEIQITVWGYDDVPPWSDMMFVKWEIFNKSENVIHDAYVTLFLDFDIGDASSNRAGCDTTLSLGYGYSGTLDDIFHPAPPGFGFVLLQGPLVPAPGESGLLFGERRQDFKNLTMTSFIGSG